MSDVAPTPPAVPPPTWLQRMATAVLPQFIAYSRKGLIWFSMLSAAGIAEYCKMAGQHLGWSEAQVGQWNSRMMFIQGALMLVAKFWTQQIADEDKALKTGLPPPAPQTTVINNPAPAPAEERDPRGSR